MQSIAYSISDFQKLKSPSKIKTVHPLECHKTRCETTISYNAQVQIHLEDDAIASYLETGHLDIRANKTQFLAFIRVHDASKLFVIQFCPAATSIDLALGLVQR